MAAGYFTVKGHPRFWPVDKPLPSGESVQELFPVEADSESNYEQTGWHMGPGGGVPFGFIYLRASREVDSAPVYHRLKVKYTHGGKALREGALQELKAFRDEVDSRLEKETPDIIEILWQARAHVAYIYGIVWKAMEDDGQSEKVTRETVSGLKLPWTLCLEGAPVAEVERRISRWIHERWLLKRSGEKLREEIRDQLQAFLKAIRGKEVYLKKLAPLESKRRAVVRLLLDSLGSFGDGPAQDQRLYLEARLGIEADSMGSSEVGTVPNAREGAEWNPVIQQARANSKWGPLVPFLAKAMQEVPAASRAELAAQFGIVCGRYPEAKVYCEGKGLDPAAVNHDTLGRWRKAAARFLEQMQANRLKSDG